MEAKVDGIILFPSRPGDLRRSLRPRFAFPDSVVCVATDAPDTGRLAVVSH